MIITRTPFRISFFGGGTDYPAWFQKHGGEVLSTSLLTWEVVERIVATLVEAIGDLTR